MKGVERHTGDNRHPFLKIFLSKLPSIIQKAAIEKQVQLLMTDPSTGEHNKIKNWMNGLMRIPFDI